MKYQSNSQIHVLQACQDDDAHDLFAIGLGQGVEILRVTDSACESLAIFHIGSRITAIAWSPKTISPSSTEDWIVEYVFATTASKI